MGKGQPLEEKETLPPKRGQGWAGGTLTSPPVPLRRTLPPPHFAQIGSAVLSSCLSWALGEVLFRKQFLLLSLKMLDRGPAAHAQGEGIHECDGSQLAFYRQLPGNRGPACWRKWVSHPRRDMTGHLLCVIAARSKAKVHDGALHCFPFIRD